MTHKSSGLANREIVNIAVYPLRGDVRAVDMEDVAIKAAEVAPDRFSPRKHPDQVIIDAVRKWLCDAYGPDSGGPSWESPSTPQPAMWNMLVCQFLGGRTLSTRLEVLDDA